MKYYTVTVTDDLEIIGNYPQVYNTDKNLFGSPFSSNNVNYGEIPKEIPYLELLLDKKANKTDLLNSFNPSFGLLVSIKFKNVVEKFKIQDYKFYSINLIENDKCIDDYYWFYSHDNMFRYFDLDKSKFSIEENREKKEYRFESEEFFKKKKVECLMNFNKTFRIEEIYLLNIFPKFDLFEFENFTFISEELLNDLEKNNITGYKVREFKLFR